jgi:hypothetical protein
MDLRGKNRVNSVNPVKDPHAELFPVNLANGPWCKAPVQPVSATLGIPLDVLPFGLMVIFRQTRHKNGSEKR